MTKNNERTEEENISAFLFGRIPPQAREFEELVLGAIMLERDGIYKVAEMISPEMFYVEAHQKIYKAIQNLFGRYAPIDIITVTEELRNLGELDKVGGAYFVTGLTTRIASSANIEYHCSIIVQKFKQRELIRVCSQIVKNAFDDTTDVFELIDFAASETLKLHNVSGTKNTEPHFRVIKAIRQIESAMNSKEITGVPSGLIEVDKLTGGWQNEDLILVAGRPGAGKSAVALQYARAAAMRGFPVWMFSLEMSDAQIGLRELAMESGMKYSKMRTGRITDDEFTEVVKATDNICNYPFFLDSDSRLNIVQLRAKLTKAIHEKGIRLAIIDYLNLMETDSVNRNKYEKVTELVKELKRTAKHLGIPIILLAQLNREVEKEVDKRPRLHHLRDTGALEEYSDIVQLLYRPAYYNLHAVDEDGGSDTNTLYIDFGKHKQGATGIVKLYCEIEKNIIKDWK